MVHVVVRPVRAEWVSAKLLESANAVASAIVVNHGRFL
jgi:hypothetical protein